MSKPTAKALTTIHVDINSYFATLLQQENPRLRGKPIGVTKDIGRSCIIAASKEAKQFGVVTGSRLKEARKLCPHLLTVPAAFDRYLDATKRLKTIFSSISPEYFIYSLDEAFIDISTCGRLYSDPDQLAQHIQQQIKDDLGEWVTCNVGISYNRLLAKMASEIAPKGSVLTITNENKDAYLASVSFASVCGIGYRLEKKLHRIGVTTPYQLRFFTEQDLEPLVGSFWAKELLRIAYGENSHNLQLIDRQLPHMKSVGRSITGYHLYDSEDDIKRIILNLLEEVAHKARQMKLAGRHVSIGLAGSGPIYGQFAQITGTQEGSWYAHKTLKQEICSTQELFEVAYHQLYRSWQRSFKVIRFAVRLSMLKPWQHVDQPLFENRSNQTSLTTAVDQLNTRYGLFTVRSGALLDAPIIRPEVTGFLGDREYQLA